MWQFKDASFDVAVVVAEESSDPACKNGKRCVLKLELLISIEQKPKKKNSFFGGKRKKVDDSVMPPDYDHVSGD